MKTLPVLLATIALGAGLAVHAQTSQQTATQTPPASANGPADKADTKASPSIAGKWVLTVDTDQGGMANDVEFKVDGKKVTGTIVSQMGTAALEGEFADSKLSFAISMDSPNGSMAVSFSGALQPDGTMAGTLSGNQGAFELNWKAERVKDK